MKHATRAALAVIAALVLGACGGSAPQQAEPPAAPAAPADTAGIQVVDSPLGAILTDAEGLTLYAFDNDEATKPQSTCSDGCAEAWPPVTTDGAPTGAGVDASLISTSPRDDGSTQVTVNEWPLYRFAGDEAPGDTNGQGSGGVWWVVTPEGTPIREQGGAAVQASESALGSILTDAEGFTLYAFANDESTKPESSCSGGCAETWPPLLTGDELITAEGFDQALLGVAPRQDGTMQLTVNGWPLYRFAGDQAPGETNGQDSGGVWHVVGTDGTRIQETPAAAATTTDGY